MAISRVVRSTPSRQSADKEIVSTSYIDFLRDNQIQLEMKQCSFKNMLKAEVASLIEPYLKNTNLDNFNMTETIVNNININFPINGNYMYYVQEQILYGIYRVYIEAYRYDNQIVFNAEQIRTRLFQLLSRLSEIFMVEARNGMAGTAMNQYRY